MSIGGHQSARAKSVVWLTPPAIIRALGEFDLDPCAAPAPRPWDTARHHLTEEDDGLAHEWFGRVWLNPPYGSEVGTWMKRLADYGQGTALIFARTETEAFFETVWRAATACRFIEGRLHFHYPDGARAKANGGAPSVLVAYGDDDAEILASCEIAGQFVPLRLPRSVIMRALEEPSWVSLVGRYLSRQSGPVRVEDIYLALARHPKAKRNPNWRAKIRQSLQRGGFTHIDKGVWAA